MGLQESEPLLWVGDGDSLLLRRGRQAHSLHAQGHPVHGLGPGELGQQVLQVRGLGQLLLLDDGQRVLVLPGLSHCFLIQDRSQVRVRLQGGGRAHEGEDGHRGVPSAVGHVLLDLSDDAGQGSLRGGQRGGGGGRGRVRHALSLSALAARACAGGSGVVNGAGCREGAFVGLA